MKTTFSNEMTCHVWAQQNQEHGRGPSIFFNGATIYSYGEHFPMASFVMGKTLINSDGYSSSTGKHQTYMRRALNSEQYANRIDIPTNLLKDVLRYQRYIANSLDTKTLRGHYKNFAQAVAQWVEEETTKAARIAAKRKKKSLISDDIAVALRVADNARAVLALFKLKLPAKTEKHLAELQTDLQAVIERNQKQIAAEIKKRQIAANKWAKEQAAKQAALKALIPLAVEKWRAGNALTPQEREAMAQTGITYLRVKGENVETSRGAEFPIEHAKRVFTLIRRCKESGAEWGNGDTATPRSTITLGHFTVERVTKEGHVKAGCHFVEWPQIEVVARELTIFP